MPSPIQVYIPLIIPHSAGQTVRAIVLPVSRGESNIDISAQQRKIIAGERYFLDRDPDTKGPVLSLRGPNWLASCAICSDSSIDSGVAVCPAELGRTNDEVFVFQMSGRMQHLTADRELPTSSWARSSDAFPRIMEHQWK
jgi:hypothetical protein